MSATDEITIAGHVFTVPVRYAAGHPLTEGEASALNQTYHENLRNNFASKVRKAKETPPATEGGEPGTKELTDDDIRSLQADLMAYADEYQFGVRVAGSPRAPADPVEREALNLAKEAIRQALKAKGKKADAEVVADLAAKLLDKNPQYREVAKQRVEAAKAVTTVNLADLAAA